MRYASQAPVAMAARSAVPGRANGAEFCLLGPLVVRVSGMQVIVSAGKQRVVLAMLLLNAGQVVSLDDLFEGCGVPRCRHRHG